MTTRISSQRHLDPEIVQEKRDQRDYVVHYYSLTLDGVAYDVIVDGNHSLAAARADGVEPTYRPVSQAVALEYDHEVSANGVQAWLEAHINDSDYYDVDTGQNVW